MIASDQAPASLVIKVGGSLVSDRTLPRNLDLDTLAAYARQVADLAEAGRGRVIFVAGGGAHGHGAARGVDPSDAFGNLSLTEATFAVKWAWTQALRNRGARAMPLQVAAMCLLGADGPEFQPAVLDRMMRLGVLPVLSGDCLFDQTGHLRIFGSDEIPSLFLRAAPDSVRVVVLTDVDGVLSDGPGGSETIPWIDADQPAQWRSSLWAATEWDTSGAMTGKVEALAAMARRGAECVILRGDPQAEDLRFLLGPRQHWPEHLRCTVVAVAPAPAPAPAARS